MLGESCLYINDWLEYLSKSLLPVSENFLLFRETHDQGAHGTNGQLGVEDATQGNLGEWVHEQQAGLQTKLLVLGNHLEKFEIKDIEASCVILIDLYLFEKGFA